MKYLMIKDLLDRFRNRALGDTIFRVGCDLKRKLHCNDRVLSPLVDGIKLGLPTDKIVKVFSCGLKFRAVDQSGNTFAEDIDFVDKLEHDGINSVLTNSCQIDYSVDRQIINYIVSMIKG